MSYLYLLLLDTRRCCKAGAPLFSWLGLSLAGQMLSVLTLDPGESSLGVNILKGFLDVEILKPGFLEVSLCW